MPLARAYSPEVIKLLDFVERELVEGLQHGFFEFQINCVMKRGELREVVVKTGRTHKFNVPADRVPR